MACPIPLSVKGQCEFWPACTQLAEKSLIISAQPGSIEPIPNIPGLKPASFVLSPLLPVVASATTGISFAEGGSLKGLAGSPIYLFAHRGKANHAVLGYMWSVIIVCLGIVALAVGQPYAVWYPCILLGTCIPGVMNPDILGQYRQAEQRLLEASALRGP